MSFTKRPRLYAYILGLAFLLVSFIAVYSHAISDALVAMGVAVPFAVRLEFFQQNLVSMNVPPIVSVALALAFTFSMIAAARIARAINTLPKWVHALAGFVAIACILEIFRLWNGINLLPASRDTGDYIAFCLCGGLAGYFYRAFIERYR